MEKLYSLLQAHQLLLGHPNLKNLQREVAKALSALDASYAPEAPQPTIIPTHGDEEVAVDRRV